MAPNPKIKKACDAMKLFGIPEAKVKLVLKNLLKTYDNKWNFIEDEDYTVLMQSSTMSRFVFSGYSLLIFLI